VKIFALLLLAAGFSAAQDQEANFKIRVDPDAVLQTKVQVPFTIRVTDDLSKPVINADAKLQIETPEHTNVQVFKAAAVGPGLYLAKPVFPFAGQWSVYVEVRRGGKMSARTLEFSVPETAPQ
jgi:hypothetical protein